MNNGDTIYPIGELYYWPNGDFGERIYQKNLYGRISISICIIHNIVGNYVVLDHNKYLLILSMDELLYFFTNKQDNRNNKLKEILL